MTEQEMVIQELRKENERLKRRISALENETWQMEKRLKKAEENKPARFIFGGTKTGRKGEKTP